MKDNGIIGMLSLFRGRGGREFSYTPRYYDPAKERLKEREKQLAGELSGELNAEQRRELMRERMRHSWHRQGTDKARLVRLLAVTVGVGVILYFLSRAFDLLPF